MVSSDLPENRSGQSMVFQPCGHLGLASDGVCMATPVTGRTVVSYTAFSPLQHDTSCGRLQTHCVSRYRGIRQMVLCSQIAVHASMQRFDEHCTACLIAAVCLCCTFPGVASAGRYPASCPVKPGLSSWPKAPRSPARLRRQYTMNFRVFQFSQTLKMLPPINSFSREFCGTSVESTPRK